MQSQRNDIDLSDGARGMQPPPASTATQILDAARSVALDVGFRRATIVDVARRAGVSRMTVYREFGDLDAIWSQLLTTELVGLVTRAAEQVAELGAPRAVGAQDVTAREVLTRAAVELSVSISDHPLFRRALEIDPEILLPLVFQRFGSSQRATLEQIEALLRIGAVDGSINPARATPSAACAILLAVQSFIFSARVIQARQDATEVRAELGVLLDGYLAP